jgi:choline kinase
VARPGGRRIGVAVRAIIYAAGVGARLGEDDPVPKILLEIGGRSLLRRHLDILDACGVEEIVIALGHKAEAVETAVAALRPDGAVRTVRNPDYRRGSIVTQWCVRDALTAGGPVLLMDADVLYDRRLLDRLLGSAHADCFLLDRDIEPDEEPVKLCIRDGHLVDFRKRPERSFDWCGESVGFFKLGEATARRLVAATRRYIETGQTGEYYDEALRDLLIADPPGRFGFEDVTGLPWTEIDFPADLARAQDVVLPRLEPAAP